MKYGYARVSTTGQSLTAQIDILEKEHCDKIYSEKYTGTRRDRPEFMKLMKVLEKGDTLVVTKLDRFARSTKDALEIIEDLFNRGVSVHILNLGIIEDSPTGRLIFTVMSAFADFERDLIVERTQEGKKIAKQHPDFKEGRPKKYTKEQLDLAVSLLEKHSYSKVVKMTGISKSTIARHRRTLNES